jgi:hypothetical protein
MQKVQVIHRSRSHSLGSTAGECTYNVRPHQTLKSLSRGTPDIANTQQQRGKDENGSFPKVIGQWDPQEVLWYDQ